MHYERVRRSGTTDDPVRVEVATSCVIDQCDRPVLHRNMCSTHYRQWWRQASDDEKLRPWADKTPRCSIDDCPDPHYGEGLCAVHYRRKARHGDPLVVMRQQRIVPGSTCEVESCEKPVRASNQCALHYGHSQRLKAAKRGPCIIDGCVRPRRNGNGLCGAHDERRRIFGSPTFGRPLMRPRGTGHHKSWYSDQRRANVEPPDRETLAYREIVRVDPCSYCGAPVSGQVDHIQAVIEGGPNHWTNMTGVCPSCNGAKGRKDLLQYLMWRNEKAA